MLLLEDNGILNFHILLHFLHISDYPTEAVSKRSRASNSSLHPPAGIWCGVLARWCWCSPCCVWRWCSTWWRRAAGCRTHTACPGPSRPRRGCGPAARHRCRPAERPWAGSAAGTTPWGGGVRVGRWGEERGMGARRTGETEEEWMGRIEERWTVFFFMQRTIKWLKVKLGGWR